MHPPRVTFATTFNIERSENATTHPRLHHETKLAHQAQRMSFFGSAYRMQFGFDIVKPNFEAGWSLGLDQDTQTRPHVKRRLRFRSRVFFQIVRSAKIYARSGWFVNLKQSIFLAEVSPLSPKVAALEMAFLDLS